jgi:hypothetical protein
VNLTDKNQISRRKCNPRFKEKYDSKERLEFDNVYKGYDGRRRNLWENKTLQ